LEFRKGDRVKHGSKPEWGLGQVLEDSVDGKVRVFFAGLAAERNLLLKLAPLIRVSGKEAQHAGLDNLKIGASSKKKQSPKSLDLLKRKFSAKFAGGFAGEEYFQTERKYKVIAHESMTDLLNQETFAQLLSSGDFSDICKRALKVVDKTNLVFLHDTMALKNGLNSTRVQSLFSQSLFQLLYGEIDLESRFTAYVDCLREIGAAKWTIATYHLFIADPRHHMFVKPTVTQQAADVCAFQLNYRSEPNWLTYKSILEFSKYLMNELQDLNPKDMIDIQSFLWCIAQD
jgi:hypothetical protein